MMEQMLIDDKLTLKYGVTPYSFQQAYTKFRLAEDPQVIQILKDSAIPEEL